MNTGSNKTLFIVIGVVLIGVVLYFVMKGADTPIDANSALEIETVNAAGSEVGDDVLILLGQIKLLNIDKAFFETDAYKSLVDYTVPIPPQNIGRENPFAPFDRAAAAQAASAATQGRTNSINRGSTAPAR
ncbi:MAG: hypothetical protein V4526_01580 [Patescibacteria group bacterium]